MEELTEQIAQAVSASTIGYNPFNKGQLYLALQLALTLHSKTTDEIIDTAVKILITLQVISCPSPTLLSLPTPRLTA